MGSSCPTGTTNIGGVCYANCKSGYALDDQNDSIVCQQVCTSGTSSMCNKSYPSEYSRGNGVDTNEMCVRINDGLPCTNIENVWYPQCIEGYQQIVSSPSICYLQCSDGSVNSSGQCPKHSIPATVVQNASISLYTIYVILVIIFVIISLILYFYYGGIYTSNTIPDILYGVPGESDAFAILYPEEVAPDPNIYI